VGGHVNLNAEEIQSIVDELFIGNQLAAGMIKGSDGTMIDLRNIRSPIVVFCSKGDNVTPPQQALGWLLDLYDDVDDIRRHGQTIVYTIHESVGHLGIFVAAGVARKEYAEFSNNIDLIDVLPPGLYEAVFEAKRDDTASPDLVTGEWIMRCEARTLDDIRALGGNDAADERRFATAARVSENNLALYRTFVQPMVRAVVSKPVAEWLGRLHPLRLQYELLSDENPWLAPVAAIAQAVRRERQPAAANNPFLAVQETVSEQIVAGLNSWRDGVETLAERTFLTIYGNPLLQAAVGIDPADTRRQRKAPKMPLHDELVETRIAELKSRVAIGDVREGTIRALLYVGIPRATADTRRVQEDGARASLHPAARPRRGRRSASSSHSRCQVAAQHCGRCAPGTGRGRRDHRRSGRAATTDRADPQRRGRRIRECGCLASYKEVQSRVEMMSLPVMREKLAPSRALWTGFRSPNLGARRE
jgi:Protein of unknown function (DUF3141)